MLIHFGSALTGAEEESVLVPVREHRKAATAGGLPSTEHGKDLTSGTSPGCVASPWPAWTLEPPNCVWDQPELRAWIWTLNSCKEACARMSLPRGISLGLFSGFHIAWVERQSQAEHDPSILGSALWFAYGRA